jgi:hypothetical protein
LTLDDFNQEIKTNKAKVIDLVRKGTWVVILSPGENGDEFKKMIAQ